MNTLNQLVKGASLGIALVLAAATAHAQTLDFPTTPQAAPHATFAPDTQQPAQQPVPAPQPQPPTVTCSSNIGERINCPADTSAGVALLKSSGAGPCLLGKSWGYDDKGIWVSDGCSAQFLAGKVPEGAVRDKTPTHVPNAGFLLFSTEKGEMYLRLFSYARYLNQRNLDPSYVDAFGNTKNVQLRQDVQLQKFFAPMSGWFMTPRFRYYLYVWSSNSSQGDPAQVVGAGNLSYTFHRAITFGAGISSLPSTRSTEGQFPYWLTVDNRLIADEFFRGSYTNGFWFKGELPAKLKYQAMFATNLSILGVSATQLDNKFDTQSYSLSWLPSTGEFGLYGTFGDFDDHQKVATRVGTHFTRSTEDRQSQSGTESIENSQIRLTDGSVIFTRELFGPGINVDTVLYKMLSLDAGVKYKGVSLEGEFYTRWLNNYTGTNVGGIAPITNTGYQFQASAMLVKKYLQTYGGVSQIFADDYGEARDFRLGANWYFFGERGLRVNGEWINLKNSPVGYTAVPYPVGGRGNLFHFNLEMNF